MKFLFILVALLVIVVFVTGPTVIAQKKCYDTSQEDMSQITSNVMTRGLSKRDVCESKFTVLVNLEACVHSTSGTGNTAKIRDSIATIILPYIRPLTSSVKEQQTIHDTDCSEYETLMFSDTAK
jgi:hypothetical protein